MKARMIHKQELDIRGDSLVKVELPVNSKVLSCGFQGYKLMIWYLFWGSHKETETRMFHVIRTGQQLPVEVNHDMFIGTATDNDTSMPFVVHVFAMY